MAGKRCAETFGGISGALWVEARGMRCVLSTVGARAGLWQEVLHGSLAMVFFFHFLGGFSREECKRVLPSLALRGRFLPSRKDSESLGP